MSYDPERDFDMSVGFEAHETVIEDIGPLYGPNGEYKEAYSGKIAVATDKDRSALEELNRLNLDMLYEETRIGAPEDCGDERPATTLVDAMLRPLGPQNMGGTSTNALVWGLVTGRQEPHLRMIEALNAAYLQAGIEYRPGGHRAEGAHGQNCGCAAIDLIPDVNDVIIDPARRRANQSLTARIVGLDRYSDSAYETNLAKYSSLSHRLDRYLSPGYQKASLELISQLSPDIQPVNQRVGKHEALAVIINRVPHTRLNQDILAATPNKTGRRLEAFGVDAWHASYLAEKLLPYDSVAQQEFEVGRAMYDAATLLAITDGSIEFKGRKYR